MRAFLAIEPSDELRAALVDVPRLVHAERFGLVRKDQLHLTLRFFAALDDARVDEVAEALARACAPHGPFTLEVRGAGTFGPRRRPHVLWAGVDDGQRRLAALVDALDAALLPFAGVREKPFAPHVTLGRGKPGARVDERALQAVGALGRIAVAELVLFESVLGRGAVHTPRARVALGAGEQAR